MKVKVCGITSLEQMRHLANKAVDFAGVIFYTGSKRYAVEKLKNEREEIKKLAIKKIGVFVNATPAEVLEAVVGFGLYAVQLHGDEDAEYCRGLMNKTIVIKAFRISPDSDIDEMVLAYTNACHFYLFDTATENFGGSGTHFDWQLLDRAQIGKPFFLSGGIGLADVDAIKKLEHLFMYGIDVNSRFEISPGIKNLDLVQTFLEELIKD